MSGDLSLLQNVKSGWGMMLTTCLRVLKGKGKAIPLQAWMGPEGSKRLRLPDFKTVGT